MKDRRAEEAFDKARKEGRILSNKGVNPNAFVPGARAGAGEPIGTHRKNFHVRLFEQRAKLCKSEREWQQAVIDLARAFGARKIAHFRPAKVTRSGVEKYETPVAEDGKGFLDLEILMDRLIKVECKFGGNTPTQEQSEWIVAYRFVGVEAHVWYPADWREVIDTLKPKE